MPWDPSRYPSNWATLRTIVLARAGNRCEGSPAFPDCRAENHQPHPVTGSHVVLTVAHVDHDLDNNGWDNLRAWCQRCHNTHDVPFRAANRRQRKIAAQIAAGQLSMLSQTPPGPESAENKVSLPTHD